MRARQMLGSAKVLAVGRFGGGSDGAKHSFDAKHDQPTTGAARCASVPEEICCQWRTDLFSTNRGITLPTLTCGDVARSAESAKGATRYRNCLRLFYDSELHDACHTLLTYSH